MAHALLLVLEDRVLDGLSNEVGALAFGSGSDAIDGLQGGLLELDEDLGHMY